MEAHGASVLPEGDLAMSAIRDTGGGEARRRRVRVLVVDDSALMQRLLQRGLEKDGDIEVVATASDPYAARDLLVTLRPDVVTLDIGLPRMDGLTFLRRLMSALPTPVVVVSAMAAPGSPLGEAAAEAGAAGVVAKPSSGVLDAMLVELAAAVRAAAARGAPSLGEVRDPIVGLGASTGGVHALGRLLPRFPADSPPIIVVQHIARGFSGEFARRLDDECSMHVVEAAHDAPVVRGQILVAPGGDHHLELRNTPQGVRVALVEATDDPRGQVPSVDTFFHSLARVAGDRAAAALLTGMGRDGADGLLAIRAAGGRTFAQDRESCAVWGMPAAAVELDAVEACVPLQRLPAALLEACASFAQRSMRASSTVAKRTPSSAAKNKTG